MSEANKVFCGECRHYSSDEFTHTCHAISTATSDWHGKGRLRVRPESHNSNNDCQNWQRKRGFVEWLNDLINRI